MRWAARLVTWGLIALFLIQHKDLPFGPLWDRGNAFRLLIYGQRWEERGFGESLGTLYHSPFEERLADRFPYLHHPPASFWLLHAGRSLIGDGVSAFRIPAGALTGIAALLLHALVEARAGPVLAASAVMLFMGSPLIQNHGHESLMELPVVPVSLVFVLLWLRWRERPTSLRKWVLAIWVFAGGVLDWGFYVLVPGMLVFEAFARQGGLRRSLWLLPCAFDLALAVVVHSAVALGSLREVLDPMLWAADNAVIRVGDVQPAWTQERGVGFLDALGRCFLEGFGVLGALVLIASLAISLWRRRVEHPLFAPAVPLFVQGMLNVLLFSHRSTTYPYFWLFLAAPFAFWRWMPSGLSSNE